ncbi:hypothetical protein SRB17_82330 [Streptomyces sp. RB17]|nr:hypothetical protein [Streptomyces sp. RB17]
MVGDSAQAICHWRGATDVMNGFNGTQLYRRVIVVAGVRTPVVA